jgi:hypothetical protein
VEKLSKSCEKFVRKLVQNIGPNFVTLRRVRWRRRGRLVAPRKIVKIVKKKKKKKKKNFKKKFLKILE